ncbi:C4b-binding protein alpha chain isoform X2 [Dromiciops gliroides]|uniref:C4b-binding protein alpha chain isoform X2 n=1 Tax=Dromiciops gliroides TaxID=33562 RepID=UPI001CC363BC|nr:C4b-binding protein alpha chain isoform X2 [Dromiciops gliroides]
MEQRREEWKGHGPTLLQIILFLALLAGVHGFCDPPPKLAYAIPVTPLEILDQTMIPEGTQVRYNCRPGYSRNSSKITLTCGTNSWYPITPFCVKKRCQHPGELNNGRVIIKTDLEFGSKIEFSCLDGYNLIGSSTSQCEIFESGVTWSDPLPECQIINCPPPPVISNGKHSNGEDIYSFGSSVTYRCNDPFSLVGKASISCTVVNGTIGTWSPHPPTCKMVNCKQPQIPNGKISSGLGPIYTYKDTIMFECNRGYILNGTNMIHCGADNQWYPDIPTCVINACTEQPFIENAELDFYHRNERVFPVGTVLTLACKRGYKAIPDRLFTATCQEDFIWQMSEGQCMRICCPTPVIDDGKIIRFTNDCRYTPRKQISLFCRGYKKYHTCQHDGTWKPEISICEDKNEPATTDCNSPPTITNGNYKMDKGVFNIDVIYSCNEGYVLVGEAENTCRFSKWSHPFPRCQALCPKPEVPNGKLSPEQIQYRSTENINVQCSPGYYLVGPQIITCSENRSWIPEVPKCEWEFPEGCEKVSAVRKLMQCLPDVQDVKMALEIHKLSLEIEMLELELSKKRETNKKPSPPSFPHQIDRYPQGHISG